MIFYKHKNGILFRQGGYLLFPGGHESNRVQGKRRL